MTKLKKLVLSLSLVLVMSVALVVGLVSTKDTTGAEPTSPKYEELVTDTVEIKKPVKLNYAPGEIQFQKGGNQIEYTYNPSVNSTEEPVVKPAVAYEYIFTNTMDGAAAIHLKGIDTNGVDVTYVVRTGSEGPLTEDDSVTSTEDYSIQLLNTKGAKVYIYILVAPVEEFIPVTFTTSVKWYYGIPQQINVIDNVSGEIVETETIVTGQQLDKKSLPTPTYVPASTIGQKYNGDGTYTEVEVPYYFDGWFADAEFTQPLNGEQVAGRKVYARFANLPRSCMNAARTTISGYTYEICKIEHVVVPTGVTTISDYAFAWSGIKSIDLPNTLTTIGTSAFTSSNFKNLKIPASVTSLSSDFVADNDIVMDTLDISGTGVTGFIVNYGIKNIIAKDCTKLIYIPEFNHANTASAFLETIDLSGCTSLEYIGITAFQGCTKLKSVNLRGSGITSIGEMAFDGCTALISVNLKDCNSLVTIENHAFASCSNLQSIIIPKNVTTIGEYAFFGCNFTIMYNLSSLTLNTESEFFPHNATIYNKLPEGYQG